MKSKRKIKPGISRGRRELRRSPAFWPAADAGRLRPEEELREVKERFQNLVEAITDWIWEVDSRGVYTYVSPRVRDLLGYEPEDLFGKTPFDLMPGEEASRLRHFFGNAVKAQTPFGPVENICLHKDGRPIVLETSGMPFFAADGSLMGYRGVDRDISERKKVEEALRNSEEKFSKVFYSSPASITINGLKDGKYIEVNENFIRISGYARHEVIGRTPLEVGLWDPEVQARFIAVFKAAGKMCAQEFQYRTKSGALRTFQTSTEVINVQGTSWVISFSEDITARKRAEEALQKSEEEARRLAQETAIMAEIGRIISSTLNIEEIYERFAAELRKLIPFDRISINVMEHENSRARIAHISGLDVAARRQGATFSLEGTITQEVARTRSSLLIRPETMNGYLERFPAYIPPYRAGLHSLIAVPLFSRDEAIGVMTISATDQIRYTEKEQRLAERIGNQIAGAIANARIFAELKRVEENLRKAQSELERRVRKRTAKLADLNRELQEEIIERTHIEELLKRAKEAAEASNVAKSAFLANMSHELRTPLNAVIGFSELMTDEQTGNLNELQKEYTEYVLQSGRHLLSLINDILDLSKVEAGKLQLEVGEVFLPALLQNSLSMIKEKSLKHGIQLQLEIDGIPKQIRGDERKLKQILFNLLSNAVKFTLDGGRVSLEARRLFYREGQWSGKDGGWASVPFVPSSPGEWVGISIRDTGVGLKAEDLERIFNPFEQGDSSVSRRFQGTGLGLALTRKFVELHGGKIWAESEGEGKGSQFHFLVPALTREIWA